MFTLIVRHICDLALSTATLCAPTVVNIPDFYEAHSVLQRNSVYVCTLRLKDKKAYERLADSLSNEEQAFLYATRMTHCPVIYPNKYPKYVPSER